MKFALLLPCYQPDEKVVSLVKDLKACLQDAPAQNAADLKVDIYVVNDGSESRYEPIFQKLESMGVSVITYHPNHGKGFALRTGIRTICETDPDCSYIITADADGQHYPEDIRRITEAAFLSCPPANISGHSKKAAAPSPINIRDYTQTKPPSLTGARNSTQATAPLLIGTRDFTQENVPLRSRLGNGFSAVYYKYVTGVTLQDTQSGLRAIPAHLFPLALETPGDHYDYEMNFLIAAAGFVKSVPVSTVYEKGNHSSHFRTVVDAVRIYRTPLCYMAASLISAGVDLLFFTILEKIFSSSGFVMNLFSPGSLIINIFGTTFSAVFAATVGARMISGIVNFLLNRRWSFASIHASEGAAGRQAIRYLLLFCTQLLASAALVTLLSALPLPLTVVKIIVDGGLSLFSYYAQHNWVFRNKRMISPENDGKGGKLWTGSMATDRKNNRITGTGKEQAQAPAPGHSVSSMESHLLPARRTSFWTLL